MPARITQNLKMLMLFLMSSTAILTAYSAVSRNWVSIGGFKSQHFSFEIPFALILLLLLFFPNAKNNIIKFILPVIPVIILYIFFDVFYAYLATSPRLSDFQNFHTLFEFSYELALGTIILATFIPLSFYFIARNAHNNATKNSLKVSLLLRLSMLIILIYFLNSSAFSNWHNEDYIYTSWSQKKTIKKNGRLSSFIYFKNKEQANSLILKNHTDINTDIQKTLFPNSISEKRNVHFIVLESFIDPRLLKDANLNINPVHPDLKPFLNQTGDFTYVTSPVYGGGTAQTEFELLTGIKALQKVSSIEFNTMKGHKISGFVNRLEQNGYISMATIATSPRFYNSIHAYSSLGFNDVTFLTEKESGYKRNNKDRRIFDGYLFDYNIKSIKKQVSANNQPIFNYVLGMYGHLPYKRNLDERPDVVKSSHNDDRVHRIANQFYYRTQAIAQYINQLLVIDPNSFIYITSDHLPPILGKDIRYKLDKKTNISILIENGKNNNIPTKNHYEIPWLIWDGLTNKETKRVIQKEEMEKLYFKALSESI